MDWHLIKTETERPVITARTMQSAVLIRKRRAMVSGASLYEAGGSMAGNRGKGWHEGR